MKEIRDFVKDKRVLFITTKNIDYLRNTQEINIISSAAEEVRLIYSDKGSYPLRLLDIYFKLLRFNMNQVDCTFIGFEPQFVFPFYKKLKEKPVMIDFFISVYDTMVNDRKKFKESSFLGRFSRSIDCKALSMADAVIVDTKADGKYFTKEFMGESTELSEKMRVLYLEADKKIFYPRQQVKAEELRDKFVVLYFGSILPLQGVDVILKAAEFLKDREDIFFEIIGPVTEGMVVSDLRSNVEFIDWLPQEELAEYIAAADLCLAGHFNADIDKASRTIAGKTYIYQAMNKPMILGDNPANHELFHEGDENIMFVPMGSPEELADAISVCAKLYFGR